MVVNLPLFIPQNNGMHAVKILQYMSVYICKKKTRILLSFEGHLEFSQYFKISKLWCIYSTISESTLVGKLCYGPNATAFTLYKL